jgi:predicted Zn-dependent protease
MHPMIRRIGKALKESMFGTNLLELFSKIKYVSKETLRESSAYLPYMFISDMTISGAEETQSEQNKLE